MSVQHLHANTSWRDVPTSSTHCQWQERYSPEDEFPSDFLTAYNALYHYEYSHGFRLVRELLFRERGEVAVRKTASTAQSRKRTIPARKQRQGICSIAPWQCTCKISGQKIYSLLSKVEVWSYWRSGATGGLTLLDLRYSA